MHSQLANSFESNNDSKGSNMSWDGLLTLDSNLAQVETGLFVVWNDFTWEYKNTI
jgi:hypothetical protein